MNLRGGHFFILLGACLLAGAAIIHFEDLHFRSSAKRVRATVAQNTDGILELHYSEPVLLRNKDDIGQGQNIVAVRTWGAHEPGDKLDIFVDLRSPQNVRVDNFIERSAVKAVLCFLGFTLLFTGMMKAGTLAIRNGALRIALSGGSAPLPLRDLLQAIPQSAESGRRDINIISHQTIRLTDPTTGETTAYNSLDQIPQERRAEIEQAMNTGLNVGPGSIAAETYVFKNPDGSDAVYHSLEEMPPDIRRIFESMHRQ